MSLNPENLLVESFVTTSAVESDTAVIGGGTEYPICIVYVSDCVSCPIEP
jgi:hypothetical protein